MPEIVHLTGLILPNRVDIHALADRHDHIAAVLLHPAHILHKAGNRERHLRQIHQVRRLLPIEPGQRRSRCQPAGIPPHDLHDRNRVQIIHRAIADDLQHTGGHKLGRRTIAGGMVGAHQVIINGFWHTDHPHGAIHRLEIAG